MTIFADLHHSDLFYSLQLLFEKRLGHTLYRPIGMDWWENGFWALNREISTAKQYLQEGSIPTDKTLPLNTITQAYGNYTPVWDAHNQDWHKAITLETFKSIPIDIVIASIPQHIDPYRKLAEMKNAKFIFQAGNVFPELTGNFYKIPYLMANTLPTTFIEYPHWIQYHQEFSTDIFKPSNLAPQRQITSFINVYQANSGFENFMALKALLPDWELKSYGGQCIDGVMHTTKEIATQMQKSAWGFHVKALADGYGFNLHEFFAVGRPVIINYEDYKKKLGGKLLIPGETCLIAEVGQNMQEVADTIQNMEPHKYEWMCSRVQEQFKKVVDFDKDEQNIRHFLDGLI